MDYAQTPLWMTVLVEGAFLAVVVLVVLGVVSWFKGRPFAEGAVFRASRLSAGNRLLPTQVLITPRSVVQYKPGWIGKQEESIHLAHVASVKIQTGLLLSDLLIETSGGASPIRCHGHRKGDALEMKRLVEQYQDEYYRNGPRSTGPADPAATAR
ncbi:MAG: hypothetical protein U0Q11_23600 [Vicinamibacterales bacterium]